MRASTDAENIGHDVSIKRVVDAGGELVGVEYFHFGKDGSCAGFIPIDTPASRALTASPMRWRVDSFDPLTLFPSVLCRICGHHGFIRDGKWVPA